MNKGRSAKNQYFLDLADLNGRTDVIEFMKGNFDVVAMTLFFKNGVISVVTDYFKSVLSKY